MPAVRLGLTFGAVMFAAGFVLGALRTILLAPRVGEVPAVLAEVPVMLAIAWIVAGRLLRKQPRLGPGAALAMGGVALAVLWVLEAAMAVLLLGVPATGLAGLFLTPGGRIGIAAQVAMALIPAVRR